MPDLPLVLVAAARESKTVSEFWDRAASVLRDAAGAAHVVLRYEGQRQRGTVKTDGQPTAAPHLVAWSDAERRVEAELHAFPVGKPDDELVAALELTGQLALMVGQRAALEHDQRLGNFVIELSRWLLAAPERDLMLRYTLQSVMRLYDAEGAYAALREPGDDHLRIIVALGRSAELDGMRIPLDQSTTGRVVRSGEALITDNVREEPDIYLPPSALSAAHARAALIVPLQSATGVLGAIGLVRFRRGGADAQPPPAFTLADLHFFMGVAAHVAGGLELSNVVHTTRAMADRAVAMVNASPLPLLLVDGDGRLHLVNEAGRRVLALRDHTAAVGTRLADLGITLAEGSLAEALATARSDGPWHGRVLVTLASGDRRICDCTVTDLEGLGSRDLLVALYDRTEELRAQHEMVAREKLATVGEIASGVAHEVNNPLATIRMEAELLSGDANPDTGVAARTIIREVDRAASIIRSLMQLVRRTDMTPIPVQLNHIVLDLIEIRRTVLRSENVTVQTDLDEAAPPVLGLGQELMQVILHLVNNAEHAVRDHPPGTIRITTLARDGWVRLLVEDSGKGVRPDIRDRIFEPFFSTKSPDEGAGLGLTVCQRVVSGLGGRIRVEDSGLGGARFVVEIPAAPLRGVEELDIR
ncbi:MAG TPA: ATP-binding protein [Gemmatimonadales bacterium]|nr:ATP-binding protein [Gemmatimonadales bacterium]